MKRNVPYRSFLLLALLCLTMGCDRTPQKKNIKIIPFGRFSTAFNDMNPLHLKSAQAIGIPPVNSREEIERYGRKLREIKSCKKYQVDKLTHSVPYLVPRAKDLLETIGEAFIDSLESRGASGYKIVVTSVLRVDQDVKKLRKRNGNASANSAHRYGTTFDIAYNRFERTGHKYEIPPEQLKHLLGEILRRLRKEKKCYVKYEIKQGCFHITAR